MSADNAASVVSELLSRSTHVFCKASVPAKKSKSSPAKKAKSPAQKKSPFRKAKSPTQKAKSPAQKAKSPAQKTKIRSSSKPCEICGREFLTKEKVRERNYHLAMVHYREEIITNLMRSKEDGENIGNFPCIKCDYNGKTYKNVLKHYVRSHKMGQEYLNKDIEAGKLEAKKADYAKSPKAKSPNISLKDIQKGKKSPIEKVKKASRAAANAARGALKEPALGTKLRQEPQKAKSPSQKTKNGKAESSTMQEKKKNVPAKKAAKKGNPLAGVTYAASNIRSEMLAIPNGDTESAKNKKYQKSKEGVSKPAKENKSDAANDDKTEAEIAQFQKEIEEYRKEKQNTKAQAKKPVKSQKEKVKKPKSSKQILEEVSHVSQLEENSFRDAKKSKPNSKTAAGLRNTNQVLKEYNANHEDNLFKPNSTQNRKNQPSVSQPKAADILGELFDSDSEQNISLHSARTPITAFFNRSSLRSKSFETSSFEVEGDAAPTTEGVEKENYAEPTFQENAFLARKAKEAERRRTHRLMKTVQHSPLDTTKTNSVRKKDGKHMEKDLRAVARYSQELLQSNVIDDTDDEADDYFSDMDGTSSINNAPSGLMSLLGKTN